MDKLEFAQVEPEYIDEPTHGIEVARVIIPHKEWIEAERMRQKWACEQKEGQWGRGLIADAVGTGLKGEIAFAKVYGFPVNIEPKSVGTGGGSDFELNGSTIEVKTRAIGSAHGHLLVRSVTEGGNKMRLKSDFYVAANVASRWHRDGIEMYLMGFYPRVDLGFLPDVPARRGSHMNKEVPYGDLWFIRDLREATPVRTS